MTRTELHHQIKARCGFIDFAVGQAVKVRGWIGRRSRVSQIFRNQLGTTIYVLQDGGHFGANELEAVK